MSNISADCVPECELIVTGSVVSAPAVSAIAPVAPVTALPAMSERVFAALAYGIWVEVIVPAIVALDVLQVGQETVPVLVIGFGLTTIGEDADKLTGLTFVTVTPPAPSAVNEIPVPFKRFSVDCTVFVVPFVSRRIPVGGGGKGTEKAEIAADSFTEVPVTVVIEPVMKLVIPSFHVICH